MNSTIPKSAKGPIKDAFISGFEVEPSMKAVTEIPVRSKFVLLSKFMTNYFLLFLGNIYQ